MKHVTSQQFLLWTALVTLRNLAHFFPTISLGQYEYSEQTGA